MMFYRKRSIFLKIMTKIGQSLSLNEFVSYQDGRNELKLSVM